MALCPLCNKSIIWNIPLCPHCFAKFQINGSLRPIPEVDTERNLLKELYPEKPKPDAIKPICLAILISALTGFVALEVLPCSWFGSSFEGACGYGALYFVFIGSILLTIFLSIVFVVFSFRRAKVEQLSIPSSE